jgi:hypothetical protein
LEFWKIKKILKIKEIVFIAASNLPKNSFIVSNCKLFLQFVLNLYNHNPFN